MKPTVRRFIWFSVAYLPALLVHLPQRPFCDKVSLSVSSVDVAFLTAGVALKIGFFQEEGLEPEAIRMNANASISALATDDSKIKA
jgi:hypothetical protein